jgi:hypothetical protein
MPLNNPRFLCRSLPRGSKASLHHLKRFVAAEQILDGGRCDGLLTSAAITEFRNCEILYDPRIYSRTPLRSSRLFSWPSTSYSTALQSLLKGLCSRRTRSRGPTGLPIFDGLQIALYTHRCQAGRTSSNRPGVESPDRPCPRIVGILT